MNYVLIAFCCFMTTLSILKYWIKQETRWHKIVVSIVTIGTGITAYFALFQMLPTSASPQVSNLYFYAYGNINDFAYCCEFQVRNDGDKNCTLEKVELMLEGTALKLRKPDRCESELAEAEVADLGGAVL